MKFVLNNGKKCRRLTQLSEIIKSPDSYADFQNLGYWTDMFKSFIAICVFFSWVKLFKYITFNRTMTQLASTLERCGGDIAGFGVMFFIVFFAYAQLGYLLFGTTFADYRDQLFFLYGWFIINFAKLRINNKTRLFKSC
jgi:polycystin 2